MTRVTILGTPVDAQRYEAATVALLGSARLREARRAHFATVHTVVEATRSPKLRSALTTAWMVCTDGLPLAWVARLRGADAERVCGPDVMLTLCDRGRALGLRHYFVGGGEGVADQLAAALSERFPGIAVAGTATPPFRELTEPEDAALVEAINVAAPDIVWVGLGSPKQELWAEAHAARLATGLILAVGAAFDFHSGRLRRAPRWMRRVGLEWLFRLIMEPRRLLRRYLVTNSQFLILLAREGLRRRIGRKVS